jgi:hypothetical protein
MGPCDVVTRATFQRVAHTSGKVSEIPVPGWVGARDCHFKADDGSKILDVIVWPSANRAWPDVVQESRLSASDPANPVEVPGAQRAVLITHKAKLSLSVGLLAMRGSAVYVSGETSAPGTDEAPTVNALMKRILAHTS